MASLSENWVRYQDSYYEADPNLAYSNRVDGERTVYPIPNIAFASPLGRNWGWGMALYGLGGAGADVRGIRRPLNDPGTTPISLSTKLGSSVPGLGDLKTITENTYSNLSVARRDIVTRATTLSRRREKWAPRTN